MKPTKIQVIIAQLLIDRAKATNQILEVAKNGNLSSVSTLQKVVDQIDDTIIKLAWKNEEKKEE